MSADQRSVSREAPEGYVWRWEVDRGWSPEPRSTGRCRFAAGNGRRACGKPAVASLNRGRYLRGQGRVSSWWDYCGEHLYGRVRVDFDGLPAVLHQALREAKAEPDDFAEIARRFEALVSSSEQVQPWTAWEGERCQDCGHDYEDVYWLPDAWWKVITPKPSQPGAGLLCPDCALRRLIGAFA